MSQKTTLKNLWHLKRATSLTLLFFCFFLIKTEAQQQVVFSEMFSRPDNDVSECTAWQAFSQELTADKIYLSVLFKGSQNETGLLLEDPVRAAQLAAAIKNNQNISFIANGQFWAVAVYYGSTWVSASSNGTTHSPGSCPNGPEYFNVRACLENGNFGGIGGPTCDNNSSQRIDLIFNYGGVDLVDNTPATCPESSDGSLTVTMNYGVAPYTFDWSNGETTTSVLQSISGYNLLGQYNGHGYYRSVAQAATLDAAQADAELNNGYVASITSAEESTWLMANGAQVGDNLGGADSDQEGVWTWASGEPFSFTNWSPGEPNDGGGNNQDYMQIYANGTWDDIAWAASPDVRHIMELQAFSKIENLTPGEYTVTVTDAEGSVYSATYTVGPDPIEIDFNMTESSSCDEVGDGELEAIVSGGTAPYFYVWNSGETVATISNKAIGEYTVTVTDANECASVQGSESIVPLDNTAPEVLAQNIQVFLDGNGEASIQAEDLDNGSTDDCALGEFSVDISEFVCEDVSNGPTVFDGNTAISFDGVDDRMDFNNVIPYSQTHTISVWLKATPGAAGAIYTWGSPQVNNSTYLMISSSRMRYSSVFGAGTSTSVIGNAVVVDGKWHHLVATRDGSDVSMYVDGNLDVSGTVVAESNNATVSSLGGGLLNNTYQLNLRAEMDEFAYWSIALSPEEVASIGCSGPDNADIYLNFESGAGTTSVTDQSGNGNSGTLVNMDVNSDWTSFGDAVETPQCPAGRKVILTVNDMAGNSAEAEAIVTVLDTIKPNAFTKAFTLALGSNGLASLSPGDVDNESTDNCQIASRSLSKTAFSCEDLGVNEVTLTVEDASGNSRSATAQVTVVDNLDPLVQVQNVQVSLDANGSGSIQVSDVEVSSSDNCGIASRVLNNSTFSCADLGEDNEVTLTVTDHSGNATQKTVNVTVSESIAPVAVAEAYTVELDADGEVTLTASVVAQFIGSGSTDNCGLNAASHALGQMVFSCEDLGANSLTYSVADASGNSDDAPVVITVVDAIAPTALAQNIVAQLNDDGVAVISGLDADNGSTDNCSIVSRELSTTEFTCEELGEHEVTLTVKDASGNENQDTFTVTVVDEVAPVIPEVLTLSVYLDESGEGVFSSAPLLAQASDNCGLDAIVIAPMEDEEYFDVDGFPFTCEEVGMSSGPLFVRDNSGNLTPFMLQLSVLDTIKPSFNIESIDLELDEEGNAVLTEAMLLQYASDNCNVAEVAIQVSNYDCSMTSGAQYTEIIVFDLNGNATQKTLEVRLKDKMAPQAQVENKSIELNQNGQADLTVGMLNMMVMDNCEAVSFELSETNFSCEDLGSHTLTMTVADAAGNVGTADFVITVEDNTAPLVSGPEVIQLCEGVPVSYDEIVATDNCSVDLSLIDGPQAGDTPPAGEFMVEFEAVDGSGNSTTKLVLLDISETPVVDLGGDIEVEEGEIVTIQAGENNTYQYNWSNGSTGPVYAFTAMEDITVSVEVITPDGCTASDEIFVSVSHPLGIDDDSAGNSVRFYPNPTKGQMSVALSLTEVATDVRISIMDISGKSVAQRMIPTAKDGDVISLDLSNYADGIYLININADSFNITKRVVKN